MAAYIAEAMIDGESEATIQDQLGIDIETFQECRTLMLTERASLRERQTAGQSFAEYELHQLRNIHDLNELISNLNSKSQYNALVGALRLRADIQDRIINKGQEFGVLTKTPEKKLVFGGVHVGDFSDRELRKELKHSLGGLKTLVEKHGGEDLMSLPVGDLHYGPSVPTTGVEVEKEPPPKAVGKARAKSSRRSAGRRRIRE